MGQNSSIEWTHHTFNPWIGCTKVDELCKWCYAERDMDQHWKKVKWGPNGTRQITSEVNWKSVLAWDAAAAAAGERHRVFCLSLGDVWERWDGPILRGGQVAKVGDRDMTLNDVRALLFDLIDHTPNLDWLLLTKRPENIAMMCPERWVMGRMPRNVWLGFSAGTRKGLQSRWAEMEATATVLQPTAVFLSAEPLLESLDVSACFSNPLGGAMLNWVIAGGESGPHARPSHPDWFRSIRDQCVEAGVPFFFKQWGVWKPISEMKEAEYGPLYVPNRVAKYGQRQEDLNESYGTRCKVGVEVVRFDGAHGPLGSLQFTHIDGHATYQTFRVGKKAAGRLLDGRTWDELPAGQGAALAEA